MREDDKRFYVNDERVIKLFELNDKINNYKPYYEYHIQPLLKKLKRIESGISKEDKRLISFFKEDIEHLFEASIED